MNTMRKVGSLALTLLLAFGLLGIGLSVCRNFMDMECAAQMAGASQNMDHCKKMCQLGRDESPAVFEKAQPKVASDTVAVLFLPFMPPIGTHLDWIHETSRLEVHNKHRMGKVYLLNTSFLI